MTNEEAINILMNERGHEMMHLKVEGKDHEYYEELGNLVEAYNIAIKAIGFTEEQAIDKLHETGWMQNHDKEMTSPSWIPITTRPCTDEEFAEMQRLFGDDIDRQEFPCFTCEMPKNGQEILVCNSYGSITIDRCEYDPDYGYELEEHGDWENIVAWMPLPEPYKMEG